MTNDEAIKILTETMLVAEAMDDTRLALALSHAIEHMKRGQWRDVENELPEKEGFYLCEGEAGEYDAAVICFFFSKYGFIDGNGLEFDAKKWMPLPKRPEGK